MPLGKLSKGQIAKGFDILEKIEAELNSKKTGKLPDLSSNFFTIIPHDFGRQRPPTINNGEALQQKKDMLMVSWNAFILKLRADCYISNLYRCLEILNWPSQCKRTKTKDTRISKRCHTHSMSITGF